MFKTLNYPVYFLILLIIALFFSIYVRIQDLGYSDFYGDELNTIEFIYNEDLFSLDFLFDQMRGPVQYIIGMINIGLFGYINEAQIRAPFLFFGILSIFLFYYLCKSIFNKESAIITTLLLSIGGLFIDFSRFAQYQSVILFLIPLSIISFLKGIKEQNNINIILSGFITALSILAHYDSAAVLLFYMSCFISLFSEIFKQKKPLPLKKMIIHFLLFFVAVIIPVALFYIPFVNGEYFEDKTSGYLENRLLGGGFTPKLNSTLSIIRLFAPDYYWLSIFALGCLSLCKIGMDNPCLFKKINTKIYKIVFSVMLFLFIIGVFSSLYPLKPRLSTLMVVTSGCFLSLIMIFNNKLHFIRKSVAVWFLGTFIFYLYLIKDPRTHVYIATIPLLFLAGNGFWEIYDDFKKYLYKNIVIIIFSVFVFYVCVFNWTAYVDKSPEYPWWPKYYLGIKANNVDRSRPAKITGAFGFNHDRGWDYISDLFDKGCLKGTYNSNSKDSITYFYLKKHQNKTITETKLIPADNIIIVDTPHSWDYQGYEKYLNNYYLLGTYFSSDYPVTYILGSKLLYRDAEFLCQK